MKYAMNWKNLKEGTMEIEQIPSRYAYNRRSESTIATFKLHQIKKHPYVTYMSAS